MKRSLVVFLVICLTLAITANVSAQDNTILVYPWRVSPDENGQRIVNVQPGQQVILGASWGACREGLVQNALTAAHLEWTLDNQPLFASPDEVAQYWSKPVQIDAPWEIYCVGKIEDAWASYWAYPLPALDWGDHPVHVRYWFDHPIHDGGDYNGDGRPDLFSGVLHDMTIILRVAMP